MFCWSLEVFGRLVNDQEPSYLAISQQGEAILNLQEELVDLRKLLIKVAPALKPLFPIHADPVRFSLSTSPRALLTFLFCRVNQAQASAPY